MWTHSPFKQNSTQRTSLPRPDKNVRSLEHLLIYFLSASSNGNEPASCLSFARNIPYLTFDTIFSFSRSGEWTRDEYHRSVSSVWTLRRVTSLRSRQARYSRERERGAVLNWRDRQAGKRCSSDDNHTPTSRKQSKAMALLFSGSAFGLTHTHVHTDSFHSCNAATWCLSDHSVALASRLGNEKEGHKSQGHEHSPETCCCTLLWAKGPDRAAFSGITDVLLISIFYPRVPFF